MSPTLALWLCLALLILLRGALTLVPSMWGWGVNVQRFLDPVSGWGLWAFAALALIPPLATRLTAVLESWSRSFAARGAAFKAFVLGALLVFFMPDRTWFIGDFMLRQGYVKRDSSRVTTWRRCPSTICCMPRCCIRSGPAPKQRSISRRARSTRSKRGYW